MYVAVCGLVSLGLGMAHVRFATYSALMAAAMLPVALSACADSIRLPARQSFARIALVALFFVLPFLPYSVGASAKAAAPGSVPSCSLRDAGSWLAPYAGQIVLANVSDTPELLYRSGVKTVGSLYHRGIAGYMRLRAAWRSLPSPTPPEAVRQTRASYVLFCPRPGRSEMVADLPPITLLDRLQQGDVPPWLEQVAEHSASGHVLYRVKTTE